MNEVIEMLYLTHRYTVGTQIMFVLSTALVFRVHFMYGKPVEVDKLRPKLLEMSVIKRYDKYYMYSVYRSSTLKFKCISYCLCLI